MVGRYSALSSQHSAFSKIEGSRKVVRGIGSMVRSRTRVLFAISSLAPASILIWRLQLSPLSETRRNVESLPDGLIRESCTTCCCSSDLFRSCWDLFRWRWTYVARENEMCWAEC